MPIEWDKLIRIGPIRVKGWKKSKVKRLAQKREECQVIIGEEWLEQVDMINYLGVMISDAFTCP